MIQEKCPYVEKCGACHMGQTTYEEELAAKKELVKSHIGKYCRNIHDVAGMYYPFHYRNKVHAVFGRLKDEVIAGTYSEGTPKKDMSLKIQIMVTIGIIVFGFALGVFQIMPHFG